MSFDPEAHREESLETWEAAASGWRRQNRAMRAFAAPVSQWLIEALRLQPGERVLELAAGIAETGLLAAELVAPGGSVLVSDQAEAMLDGARERARELGVANVEFKVLNAEWIDLPVASVDAVLCRWGYMLMADPPAALSETRRVLRAGGRLALAVWDAIERNPWAALPRAALLAGGLAAAPQSPPAAEPTLFIGGAPGPFALGERGRVHELLADAGFTDIEIAAVDLVRRHSSFEEFWETTLDISPGLHDAVMSRPPQEVEQLRQAVREQMAPYIAPDGSVEVPGRTLLARASA